MLNNNSPTTAGAKVQMEMEAVIITASGLSNPAQLFDQAASLSVTIDQTASGAPLVIVPPMDALKSGTNPPGSGI